MTQIRLEHNEMTSELFAKVSFGSYMSDWNKEQLKKDWEKFKKQVDMHMKHVNTPED